MSFFFQSCISFFLDEETDTDNIDDSVLSVDGGEEQAQECGMLQAY